MTTILFYYVEQKKKKKRLLRANQEILLSQVYLVVDGNCIILLEMAVAKAAVKDGSLLNV